MREKYWVYTIIGGKVTAIHEDDSEWGAIMVACRYGEDHPREMVHVLKESGAEIFFYDSEP